MSKIVNVTVKLVVADDVDIDEVLANMEYFFSYEDENGEAIEETEIVGQAWGE